MMKSIYNPVYFAKGVLHYVVDHTPTLIFNTASKAFGNVLVRYIEIPRIANFNKELFGARRRSSGLAAVVGGLER